MRQHRRQTDGIYNIRAPLLFRWMMIWGHAAGFHNWWFGAFLFSIVFPLIWDYGRIVIPTDQCWLGGLKASINVNQVRIITYGRIPSRPVGKEQRFQQGSHGLPANMITHDSHDHGSAKQEIQFFPQNIVNGTFCSADCSRFPEVVVNICRPPNILLFFLCLQVFIISFHLMSSQNISMRLKTHPQTQVTRIC